MLFTEEKAKELSEKYQIIIQEKFPNDKVDVGCETKPTLEYEGKFRVYVHAPYSEGMENIETYLPKIALELEI